MVSHLSTADTDSDPDPDSHICGEMFKNMASPLFVVNN